VRKRKTQSGARRDLSVLRAAINFHREEGLCDRIVSVTLPEKEQARDRWLTRSEAAALIWRAWRYREVQKGQTTGRRSRQHVARFILALYTGTRAGAVRGAAFERVVGVERPGGGFCMATNVPSAASYR
jgi:integrase